MRPSEAERDRRQLVAVTSPPSVGYVTLTIDRPRWLTEPPPAEIVRVRATDLQQAQRDRVLILAARSATADDDTVDVIVEIDVHIADDARTARRELGSRLSTNLGSITYIGTSAGLAGLIDDMRTAKVADGVILRPILDNRAHQLIRRVVDEVLPRLHHSTVPRTAPVSL